MTHETVCPAGFNHGPQGDGVLKSLIQACAWIAVGLLILTPATEACAGLKMMRWQPFQIKMKLLPEARKGKAVKGGKAVLNELVKKQAPVGPGSHRFLDPSGPDARSVYLSRLSEQVWGRYLRHAQPMTLFPDDGIPIDPLFFSDRISQAESKDLLMFQLSAEASGAMKETAHANYFRLSFFSQDMKYINRDVAGRDPGRTSGLEKVLIPWSGLGNQAVLETMGRIFEPRVDLGIEF